MAAEQQYIDLYRDNSALIKGPSAEVLNAPRDRAYKDFCRQGFPTRKVERYKYTDMRPLLNPITDSICAVCLSPSIPIRLSSVTFPI